MSDLIVLGFDHIDDAAKVLIACCALQYDYLLVMADAVAVMPAAYGTAYLLQSLVLA